LSPANFERSIDFDVTYKDSDVKPDENPNMIINHTIKVTNQDNHFIKIYGIEYDVEILETNAETVLINLGKTYSPRVSFFSTNDSTDRSVLLKFPINEFTKIVDHKLRNGYGKLLFKIGCEMHYEVYYRHDGKRFYYLKKALEISPSKFMHDHHPYRVQLSDEQISSLIRKNKYTERLRTDLTLLDEPINNEHLAGAIENLKQAARGYNEGNFSSVILNIRNALANDLTEKVGANAKKKNALKNGIKEKCLMNIPEKDKGDYKEILNYIGKILASLLSINHKYAHENQSTIRMRPLHADLELLYFSVSLLTKYLTTLNNTKV
jgi:hypothetical protein